MRQKIILSGDQWRNQDFFKGGYHKFTNHNYMHAN